MVEGQCEKLLSTQKVQINILFLFYYYYECIPLHCFKRGQKLPILSGQKDCMGASQRHKLPSTSRSCYRDNLHKQSCCGSRNGVVWGVRKSRGWVNPWYWGPGLPPASSTPPHEVGLALEPHQVIEQRAARGWGQPGGPRRHGWAQLPQPLTGKGTGQTTLSFIPPYLSPAVFHHFSSSLLQSSQLHACAGARWCSTKSLNLHCPWGNKRVCVYMRFCRPA